MSSMLSLSSQGVVFAAAMAVSSTVLFLAFSKQKSFKNFLYSHSSTPNLRSCLSSEETKKEKKKKKKKKRVKFAENVKDTKGNGEEYRREKMKFMFGKQENEKEKEKSISRICRNEINGMPANRIALYNGILRDRVHRTQCSY